VRLSAETIKKGADTVQAPRASDKVEDNAYDKLTTSKLAKSRGIRTAELTDKLLTAGLLVKDGHQYKLTEKGKAAGGEFRFSKKFGPYFIWPTEIAL